LLDIQEARGFMDSYDKDAIIEIYDEWLTTSTMTFRNILDGKGYEFLPECEFHSVPFEE
jgi:hypothetical protein